MIPYEDFLAEVRERKRLLWVKMLAAEPPGRAVGRRPRDPLKEAILARLDAKRLERLAASGAGYLPAPIGAVEVQGTVVDQASLVPDSKPSENTVPGAGAPRNTLPK